MRSKGLEERLFLYCDDFAEALHVVIENFNHFKSLGTVDISNKTWQTIRDVSSIVSKLSKEILGKDIVIYEGSNTDTHCLKNEPSQSLLNDLWVPKVSLEEGIRRIFIKSLDY